MKLQHMCVNVQTKLVNFNLETMSSNFRTSVYGLRVLQQSHNYNSINLKFIFFSAKHYELLKFYCTNSFQQIKSYVLYDSRSVCKPIFNLIPLFCNQLPQFLLFLTVGDMYLYKPTAQA